MAIYSGKQVTLPRPVNEIFDKISDLTQYRSMVEQLPEGMKSKLQGIEFEGDSVKMNVPAIGALTFRVTERKAPEHVGLEAIGAPVPLHLAIDLASAGENVTLLTPKIDIDIPMMLKPLVGGKLQEAADKFGDVFTGIFK